MACSAYHSSGTFNIVLVQVYYNSAPLTDRRSIHTTSKATAADRPIQTTPDHPALPVALPHDPTANLSPTHRSTVAAVSRPSLKIIRHDDRRPPGDVSFEVWNPIAAHYE